MGNPFRVQKVNTSHYLIVEIAGFSLSKPAAVDNVIKEFPSAGVLHNEVNVWASVDDVVQFHNTRVVYSL